MGKEFRYGLKWVAVFAVAAFVLRSYLDYRSKNAGTVPYGSSAG
jgi:hypothetical protein